MASPELTSQPPFSFDVVVIRPDPDAVATFRTSRLAWVIGHRDTVKSLKGSSATATSSPGGDAPTPATAPTSSSNKRVSKGVSGSVIFSWR
ncbi:hypothetical protein TRIUR3_31313 [Triticum urartu]|uniref:Uncharacterized protein n=1 Tax=Triticum urartu TaxID=4572 RepID=M7ZNH5_TRIUA|nr:hypothetical protein TRIUR3_31313 [Triticum urartu]